MKKYLVPGALIICVAISLVMWVLKPIPHGHRYDLSFQLSLVLAIILLFWRVSPGRIFRRGVLAAILLAGLGMGALNLATINPRAEIVSTYSTVFEAIDGVRLANTFRLPFKPCPAKDWTMGSPVRIAEEEDRYLSGASAVYLRGRNTELAYERISGKLMWGLAANTKVLLKGPALHVLKSEAPAGEDPAGWKFAGETHGDGRVRWEGTFGKKWKGGYDVRLDTEGNAEFTYDFTYLGPDLWVRELGLKFDLPLSFAKLEWDRRAEYAVYPGDHIGRPRGITEAHPKVAQTVPPDSRPFALDDHVWGSNDFRSAKRNIYSASLSGPGGRVRVVSDGIQTVRCTVTPHEISMKVLDFYGGSGGPKEWSVLGFHYGAGRLIKTGETVKGTVRLKLIGP
jgi:hypothetical protein